MAGLEDRGASGFRVVWREHGEKQYERFGTIREAEDFKSIVEASGNRWPHGWVKGRGYAEPESRCPTFAQWADRAIASRSRANRRTRADYLRDLTNHVLPTFGDLPLDRIDGQTVGAWLIRLTEPKPSERRKPLAAKSVKNVHALASSIYADAIQAGKAPGPNPFKGAMRALPVVRVEEMVFLSKLEVDMVADAIGETYRPLVLLLAFTGLRWSEATALKVGDVELFGPRRLTVSRAWKRDDDGTFYVGEPKSNKARRTLALDAAMVDTLIPLVASRPAGAWLFTTATGRVVQHSAFYKSHWRPTIKSLICCDDHRAETEPCGCPGTLAKRPRIHDLRHTQASWLINNGLAPAVIQRRMGHESIQTTYDRYGHLFTDSDDRVVAVLDEISGAGVVSAEAARILER